MGLKRQVLGAVSEDRGAYGVYCGRYTCNQVTYPALTRTVNGALSLQTVARSRKEQV